MTKQKTNPNWKAWCLRMDLCARMHHHIAKINFKKELCCGFFNLALFLFSITKRTKKEKWFLLWNRLEIFLSDNLGVNIELHTLDHKQHTDAKNKQFKMSDESGIIVQSEVAVNIAHLYCFSFFFCVVQFEKFQKNKQFMRMNFESTRT